MAEIHLSLTTPFHNAFCSSQDCHNISIMLLLPVFSSVSVILIPPFCCLGISAVQLLLLGTCGSSLLLDYICWSGMFLSLSVSVAYLLFSSMLIFSFPLLYSQISCDNHSTVISLHTHFPLPVCYRHAQAFICFPFFPTLNNQANANEAYLLLIYLHIS